MNKVDEALEWADHMLAPYPAVVLAAEVRRLRDVPQDARELAKEWLDREVHHPENTTEKLATFLTAYRARILDEAAERDELRFYERALEWRGIKIREYACPKCGGSGSLAYGSTSTWRGGIGGQAITNGVCDECWGSGDKMHKWDDLRKFRARILDEAAERGVKKLLKLICENPVKPWIEGKEELRSAIRGEGA